VVSCYVFLHLSQSWRTLAYQKVRLWIGPLAKLGRFKSTADNFLVYIVTISLSSGPVWRSNVTSFMYVCWLSQSFNTFFPPTSVTLGWHEAANELTAKTRSNTFLSNAIDSEASTSERFPSTSKPDLCRKYRMSKSGLQHIFE